MEHTGRFGEEIDEAGRYETWDVETVSEEKEAIEENESIEFWKQYLAVEEKRGELHERIDGIVDDKHDFHLDALSEAIDTLDASHLKGRLNALKYWEQIVLRFELLVEVNEPYYAESTVDELNAIIAEDDVNSPDVQDRIDRLSTLRQRIARIEGFMDRTSHENPLFEDVLNRGEGSTFMALERCDPEVLTPIIERMDELGDEVWHRDDLFQYDPTGFEQLVGKL